MQKIAVNRCFGGFGLSEKAMLRYAEIKGVTLFVEKTEYGFLNYWTVPEDQRPAPLNGDAWHNASLEERQAYNAAYSAVHIYDKEIERDDPALIQTIEELGDEANGEFAQLDIAEIPDCVEWQVEEYDGTEYIAEKHRTW